MPPWKPLPPQSKLSRSAYDRRSIRRRVAKEIKRERDVGVQRFLCFEERPECVIGQYADYVSFSDIALETAMDESVKALAKEMAYKMALTLSSMISATTDS